MRVCVVSDLHGRLPVIPDCEVLINCGDIAPDMDHCGWDPSLMAMRQTEWYETEYYEWEQSWPTSLRVSLATPGNHDWVTKLPDKCRTKLYIDESAEAYGRRFWFTPWVQECGPWNYIMPRDLRKQCFADIPYKLDILVAHAPAFGVGDLTYSKEPAGCRELRAAVQQKQPRYLVHGHIHEGQRFGRQHRLGGTRVFNAAMWGDWSPVIIDL